MNVLGIESSCDDTAASIVKDGRTILSSVVSSQIKTHHPYGGVVPELASRKHIEAIVPVVVEAISSVEPGTEKIDAVAVTQGPGLVGSLLVGFSFAKAYAYVKGIPCVGINHLHGHVQTVFLESDPPDFPFIALLASGGHTSIYYVTSHITMEKLGQTRDDAAGEAFDKVAKMLGLGYPGGPVIDTVAKQGDPYKINFPRSYLDRSAFDFSFSGLKTAVRRYISDHEKQKERDMADIAASFQEAVVDVLVEKTIRAAQVKNCQSIAIVGGVAANSRLRFRAKKDAQKENLSVFIPSIALCGDNAAMIAAAGYHYLAAGHTTDMDADVYSRAKEGH